MRMQSVGEYRFRLHIHTGTYITHCNPLGQVEISQISANDASLVARIDEQERGGAGLKRLNPNLTFKIEVQHDPALRPKWVLVDRDGFRICQQEDRFLVDRPDIVAEYQWGGHDDPQKIMGFLLDTTEMPIAYLQEIRIIPAPGAGKGK